MTEEQLRLYLTYIAMWCGKPIPIDLFSSIRFDIRYSVFWFRYISRPLRKIDVLLTKVANGLLKLVGKEVISDDEIPF